MPKAVRIMVSRISRLAHAQLALGGQLAQKLPAEGRYSKAHNDPIPPRPLDSQTLRPLDVNVKEVGLGRPVTFVRVPMPVKAHSRLSPLVPLQILDQLELVQTRRWSAIKRQGFGLLVK